MFDLEKLQQEFNQTAKNLFINEEEKRDNISKDKIINLYERCRQQKKLIKTAYWALNDQNLYVKLAALDLIQTYPSEESKEYLFKALEDEENINIRQKIVESINKIESEIKKMYTKEDGKITISGAVKYLNYS